MLTNLIEEGARAGGFRRVAADLVAQIADAAHARTATHLLAVLGMTHTQAADGLISILPRGSPHLAQSRHRAGNGVTGTG